MKPYVVDTNALLRFILKDVSQQYNQVEKLLMQAKIGKVRLVVLQIVVFELHFALLKYYHFGKVEIIEKLESFISSAYLDIESRAVFLEALKVYRNTSISFVDCFLAAKAKKESCTLFTFDKDLRKLMAQ